MLRALIETYLREVGFTTYELDGVTYWGHERLGQGRRFEDALAWWMGCETVDNGPRKRQPDPSGSGSQAPDPDPGFLRFVVEHLYDLITTDLSGADGPGLDEALTTDDQIAYLRRVYDEWTRVYGRGGR